MRAPRPRVSASAGLSGLEACLQRAGFDHVAGVDEAGRGPCAGPLVVAAVVLPAGPRGQVPGLADSKLLSPAAREQVAAQVRRRALAAHCVVVPAAQVDAQGVHVADLEAMRRAVAGLAVRPSYVLSDGFAVPGTGVASLAVVKGDRVAACVAAAGVLAKTTRDALMTDLDAVHPGYGFAEHRGYSTEDHVEALSRLGPCAEHRWSWEPVRRSARDRRLVARAPGGGWDRVLRWETPRDAGDRTRSGQGVR